MTYFREYDARLGRFWGIDPVTHEWESPYAAMGGNPVSAADPSGADSTETSIDANERYVDKDNLRFGSGPHEISEQATGSDGMEYRWVGSSGGYYWQAIGVPATTFSGSSPFFLGLDMQMLMQDYDEPSIQMPSLAYRADRWYTGALHDISTDPWARVFFPQVVGFAELLQVEYGVRDAINVVITSHIFDRGRHLNGNIVVGQEGVDAHVQVAGLLDGVFVGIGGSAIGVEARIAMPRGFTSIEQFNQAVAELDAALIESGISDGAIGVRGSSVTGVKFRNGQPFDATSDIDFFVESQQLTEGLTTSKQTPGFVHPDKIMPRYDPIVKWSEVWSEILHRKISVGGFQPGTVPNTPVIRP